MKILFLCIVAIGALATEVLAQAPDLRGAIKLGKVELAGVKSPEFMINGGPQKRSKVGTWLEAEVEYETKAEDIDELTFDYYIEVDVSAQDKRLRTGTVTYINIPKGREHYAVMYIPPRTLEKLAGAKPPGSNVAGAWVTVSHLGQVLDQAGFKLTGKPNLPQAANAVLNKNETPFAPLFYDRYETIKVTK